MQRKSFIFPLIIVLIITQPRQINSSKDRSEIDFLEKIALLEQKKLEEINNDLNNTNPRSLRYASLELKKMQQNTLLIRLREYLIRLKFVNSYK